MKKSWNIFALIISLLIIVIIIFGLIKFFSKRKIEYKNKQFELRYDELGVMFFNENNGGDFSVKRTFIDNKNCYFLLIHEFQGKRNKWVKLEQDKMIDIDSSHFKFDSFKDVDNQELLK